MYGIRAVQAILWQQIGTGFSLLASPKISCLSVLECAINFRMSCRIVLTSSSSSSSSSCSLIPETCQFWPPYICRGTHFLSVWNAASNQYRVVIWRLSIYAVTWLYCEMTACPPCWCCSVVDKLEELWRWSVGGVPCVNAGAPTWLHCRRILDLRLPHSHL